jgi:beta-lactamase regulating signal transducer with metallopeptidase domain
MMTEPWLLLARFAVACMGSLVLAFALAALLRLAARRWPALLAHRSVWLCAQAAVALVFVLALAPLPRNNMAPAFTRPTDPEPVPMAQQAVTLPLTQNVSADLLRTLPTPTAPSASTLPDAFRHYLPAAWLLAYLAGLAWHAARRLHAQRRWLMLLRQTRIIDAAELQSWPGVTSQQRAVIAKRLTVCTIDLPISPMLHGVRRPCLLLPSHVAALSLKQQQMIVEHELTHWRRADPLWLMISGVLALLFWFNRPYQRLDSALRDAVELGCDDSVLAGASGIERRGYAGALVAQLRRQSGWQPGAAFGSPGVAGRVERMRAAQPARLSMPGRMLVGASVAALALLGAALQPAFPSGAPEPAPAPAPVTLPAAMPPLVSAPLQEAWRYPLAQVRVTSLYGVVSPNVPTGHHGIDLAAHRGTPVFAVAAGTVLEAQFNATWGHYVRIDHGGKTSSLLIHLERIEVRPGQQIKAGELLGASGASGKATGPHLHLEYWHDGQRLDPARKLPDLLQRATAKAIARREAQGNPVPIDL